MPVTILKFENQLEKVHSALSW